jgi:hypothetical protein
MFKDVQVRIIRANFVEGIIGSVPLIQDFLNQVFLLVHAKAKRPLFRFVPRVGLHLHSHDTSIVSWLKKRGCRRLVLITESGREQVACSFEHGTIILALGR